MSSVTVSLSDEVLMYLDEETPEQRNELIQESIVLNLGQSLLSASRRIARIGLLGIP